MAAAGSPQKPPVPQRPDRYSRLVGILKVTLPLVALAMLAAMFLIQPDSRDSGGLVFSQADLSALGSGLRITNANFDGSNPGGDRFSFTSAVVVPDAAPPTRADLTDLEGQVVFAGGPTVDIKADKGVIVLATRTLTLTGKVDIRTSDGQQIQSSEVVLDLAKGRLEAKGGVETGAPEGTIASNSLVIVPADEASGSDRRFSFGNGVRLRYDPTAATP